jgi:anti-sigma factor RsiW
MSTPEFEGSRLLMQAALDGELDAKGALEVEQRIADDPALAAEWERLQALRVAMREKIPRDRMPDHLRATIEAMAAPRGTWRPPARPSWLALAASVVVASGLTGVLTSTRLGTPPASIEEMLVLDHMRALLAPQPVDIPSTDRHEVKPWFNARLALSPSIAELGDEGYAFLGGRIDVVGGAPAATLVYRLRNHLISVTALPAASGPAPTFSLRGFRVARWQDGDLAYWAVSDVPQPDLEAFSRAYRAKLAMPTPR